MPKPIDAVLKALVDVDPGSWLTLTGHSPAPVEVIEAEVSTVTAAADKVIRVNESSPWILHLEFQARQDAELEERLLVYNALLQRRHQMNVRSLVILLRPGADHSQL